MRYQRRVTIMASPNVLDEADRFLVMHVKAFGESHTQGKYLNRVWRIRRRLQTPEGYVHFTLWQWQTLCAIYDLYRPDFKKPFSEQVMIKRMPEDVPRGT